MKKENNEVLSNNDKKIFSFSIVMLMFAVFFVMSCEALGNTSIEIVKNVTSTLTEVIKNEVRYGLEIISALVGGWHAAKSSTIQPLIMGTGAAGIIEVLFQVIK